MIIERNKITAEASRVLSDRPGLPAHELPAVISERLGIPTHLIEEALEASQEIPS